MANSAASSLRESIHNMTREWMPQIDQLKCTGCGDCIIKCPTAALGWESGKAILLHPEVCIYCADCEDVCPASAVELPYLIVKGETRTENKDE